MYGSNTIQAVKIDEVTETVDDLVEFARSWWHMEKDPVKKVSALVYCWKHGICISFSCVYTY